MNKLSANELDYLFSPAAIRDRAGSLFSYTQAGKGHFRYHAEKLPGVIDYVIEVIRKNYPTLEIPFHSRWGHFRAGGTDRTKDLDARLAGLDPLERARAKLDLVIPSVLLDAGAGAAWSYGPRGGGPIQGKRTRLRRFTKPRPFAKSLPRWKSLPIRAITISVLTNSLG